MTSTTPRRTPRRPTKRATAAAAPSSGLTLEQLLVSPAGFALPASPLQIAIARIADGRPLAELASHSDVVAALGGVETVAALRVGHVPAELYVLAGIRGGKSLLAAAIGVCATQRCDLSRLRVGEMPRVSIVSPTTDLSRVVYQHLRGTVEARPALRALLVEEPTADSIMLRHPSGVPVEIKIVAGARAGASLVARWSAGAIFDEFPRMHGADEGVVNFDDARSAVMGRLLPGAQLVAIGSPWAPFGPAYDVVQEHFGKPSRDRIVIRGKGPQMNPSWWTPERCEELARRDPIAYRTDVEGEFADPEAALFGQDEIQRCTRKAPVELVRQPDHSYVAAIDPATRSDAFTLVVLTRIAAQPFGSKLSVALVRKWQAVDGKPLSPDAVLGEIAALLRPYGVRHVVTDQWAADALCDLGRRHELHITSVTITAQTKVELFETLRTLVADQRIELAPVPELLEDIRRVRKRTTQQGITIELPRVGRRHCDFAMALALAASQYVAAPPNTVAEPLPDGWTQEELDEAEATARRLRPRTPFGPEPGEGREEDDEWWNTPEDID